MLVARARVSLSFDAGCERAALVAATMVDDILRLGVGLTQPGERDIALQVHVGDAPPRPAGTAPLLVIHSAQAHHDALITLPHAPWSALSPVRIPRLQWSPGQPVGIPQLSAADGVVCTRDGETWHLYADLPGVYGREVLRHATADGDVRALLASQLVMRALLSLILPLPDEDRRALSLITVDAEDQLRYYINSEARCSTIRGTPDDDLQFANSCRSIMQRCEEQGLKAVFMVTGDEIDPSFTDAFGHRLIGLDDNRRVLDEMAPRGHDVACHGFDHEWWISKGQSAITPMTMAQKLRYFFETSGDLRTLFGLARFLLAYGPRLLRARAATRARARSIGEPFTDAEIRNDLERWMKLVGFRGERLFIRYPGYVRSAAAVSVLDDCYANTVDSSDLYELEDGVPAFPYSLIVERDGQLRRTRIIEIPCLWIDKLLRTRDAGKVAEQLSHLQRLAAVPGSILSFITHTKVLGATWGHCHVYLHDPLKGMALPASPEAWEAFAKFLREHTRSGNWRDLQQQLLSAAA